MHFGRIFASAVGEVFPRMILLTRAAEKAVSRQDGTPGQRVECDPRTRATPMIALAGSRQARDLMKNYQLGANRQIQETASCSEFEAVVRQPGVRPLVNRKAAAATFLAQ